MYSYFYSLDDIDFHISIIIIWSIEIKLILVYIKEVFLWEIMIIIFIYKFL